MKWQKKYLLTNVKVFQKAHFFTYPVLGCGVGYGERVDDGVEADCLLRKRFLPGAQRAHLLRTVSGRGHISTDI